MRIVHIIPTLKKGGAERLCMDICSEFQKRDVAEVMLLVLHNKLEYIVADTVQPSIIPSTVELSVWRKNVLNVAGLEEAIFSFRPDIIHSHLFEAEIVSRSINYPKAKWFSHCHDNMWQLEKPNTATLFSKRKFTAYYERLYLLNRYRKNGGNRFIAISKDTQAYFNLVLPSDLRNVTLLHNAVNTSKFTRPAGYTPKRIADLELVTAGSLVAKKNQVFLLQVVKRLTKKNYKVHLHLLGDGPDRTMLEQKASSLRINDSVTFHGNVPNVEEFLWNSDIYVHAATYEPFGLVLVEAMAAGLPVVSLDGRGNRDIIQDQKNGYILSEPDVVDFANKVALLFHDKFKYEQIKQAAIETAKQFDIVNYTDKLLALYQKALKEK